MDTGWLYWGASLRFSLQSSLCWVKSMRAAPGEMKLWSWELRPLHEVSLQGSFIHAGARFTGEQSRTLIHPPACAYAACESDMVPKCVSIHRISSQGLGIEVGYLQVHTADSIFQVRQEIVSFLVSKVGVIFVLANLVPVLFIY